MGIIDNILNIFNNVKTEDDRLFSLSNQVRMLGLDSVLAEKKCYIPRDDESYRIGTALVLANHYNFKFEIGTCFGDCRAVLNQQDWVYTLDKTIPSTDYGTWVFQNPNEVDKIYAYGSTVLEAILRCLINAKAAKVI